MSTGAARRAALFLPDFTPFNAYQWLLGRALEDAGVDVRLSDGIGRLPLTGAVKAYGVPDVLHLHWTHPFVLADGALAAAGRSALFAAQLRAAKAAGAAIVWTAHNIGNHERAHATIERTFQRLLVRWADAVIVHDDSARAELADALALPPAAQRRVHVVPHGHYRDAYPRSLGRAEARASFGLSEDETALLYFGQIRPYRGVDRLLDAFASLDDARLRLLVAGQPGDDALRKRIEHDVGRDPRIHAQLGFVPDDEVQRWFTAADVVALPYERVLTSGSALLALTFGRAVVAPRLGSLPNVLDERGSVLYEPGIEGALENALATALGADLEAMGRYNHALADRFGWDRIAALTREVYDAAVARAPGRRRSRTATGPSLSLSDDVWSHRVLSTRREIELALPTGAALALLDDGTLGYELGDDLPLLPFPERGGVYWGVPADDDAARAELDRLLDTGTRFLAIAWPAFWWLDAFPGFRRRLNASSRCVLRTDRLAVFDLRARGGVRRAA